MSEGQKRLIAYVGCNHVANFQGGGISIFEVSADGSRLDLIGSTGDQPKRAGYLAYSPRCSVLYAVDERKTDGRGPIRPASNVSSWRVDPATGLLTFLNSQRSVGAMPAAVTIHDEKRLLFTANHGFFDHVVKVVETADGKWVEKFEYDDSTVVQYGLEDDGSIGEVQDVFVLTGRGVGVSAGPNTCTRPVTRPRTAATSCATRSTGSFPSPQSAASAITAATPRRQRSGSTFSA